MKGNFDRTLPWVLIHEGGFVDHPQDPGGATNLGVTQRVYSAWRASSGLTVQAVAHISQDEAAAIYRRQYWDAARCDDLPGGLDYAVFDFAVNSGPSRAVRYLQKVLGVAQDGAIGEVTIRAANARDDIPELIADYCGARMKFVRGLSTFKTFGRGWTRRIMGKHDGAQDDDDGVIDRATKLANGMVVRPPKDAAPGKAVQADAGVGAVLGELSAKEAITAGGAVVGSLGAMASGDGPIQWAVAAVLVMVAAAAVLILVRRKVRS